MKKACLTITVIILSIISVFAQQSVAINNTGASANSSAMLDVASTNKGLLIPRMTTVQRTGILNKAVGLMVFDTNTNSFWYFQSSGWSELQNTSTNPWQKYGNDIYNNNSGNVGIGTSAPTKKLEVIGGIKSDQIFINGGNTGYFLINNGNGGLIGFKKGFSGLGLNYCIAITGVYPSQNKPVPSNYSSIVLAPTGIDPFIGEIMLFAGNFAPRGYAFCNGQLLPISGYQALFSLLGTTYGGNGVNNFALPDLRDAVPVHAGAGINWQLGEKN